MGWSNDKESVAHHEAGHWVMAHVLNRSPGSICLKCKSPEESWEGSSNGHHDDGHRELIQVLYGGPWAEILFQARKGHPKASFDENDEPTLLVSRAQNAREDGSDDRFGTPEVKLILSDGKSAAFVIDDPNPFSADDVQAVRFANGDKNLLREILLHTRNQMNKDGVWSAVERLAKALVDKLGNGTEVSITGEEGRRIVAR